MQLPRSTARLALVIAGMVGAAGAIAVAEAAADGGDDPTPAEAASSSSPSSDDDGPGDISGPCDEAENADDARCAGVVVPDDSTPSSNPTTPTVPTTPTAPTTPTTGAPMPSGGGNTVRTPGGKVTYTHDGATLHLGNAVPAAGWAVEVEQSNGREIELDFRSGSQRIQVNIEFEDGRPRERVRLRDDADDTDIRIEDGVVEQDRGDDDSGSGSDPGHSGGDDDSSGSGHSGGDDDNSGSGSGSGSRHSGGSDDD